MQRALLLELCGQCLMRGRGRGDPGGERGVLGGRTHGGTSRAGEPACENACEKARDGHDGGEERIHMARMPGTPDIGAATLRR
ncbi:hypothetical protein GCM10022382_22010 [Microbacterium invictum]